MALDPIVSLTVAVAESPGSYAFLLGSGVSRDSGVPTGAEVFWQTVGALYRLENETEETPDQAQLGDWLEQTERANLNYSGMLELLVPALEDRRAYLAGFFKGHEHGESHHRLAALAARGLIRVFVTTNFDRLLEHALREAGLEPVVVTSDADLSRAPAREHVPCYVLKVHGDYLQQTIRNTAAELAALEPGVAGELRSIIDRSGLVVIGYSGSDEAIADAIRARSSRYSLYWISRGELGEPARSLVETNAGFIIVRPDAGSFLADLERRLAVYEAHPSGETPELVNAEVLALLRAGDAIGLRELLKNERRAIERAAEPAILERQSQNSSDALVSFAELMAPLLERYLAASFPLIEHDSPLWDEQVRSLAELTGKSYFDSGYVMWIQMPRWLGWWLANACGGFAVAVDNLRAVRALLEANVDRYRETLGTLIPGESTARVGESVMRALVPGTNYKVPYFEQLLLALAGSEFFRERYPEFAGSGERVLTALNDFNFLATLYAGAHESHLVGTWTIYNEGGLKLSQRLRENVAFRARVAEQALDVSVEELGAQGQDWLEAAYSQAGYRRSDAHLRLDD
jgi:hypothetical protein